MLEGSIFIMTWNEGREKGNMMAISSIVASFGLIYFYLDNKDQGGTNPGL
jgi:hypothetical protein